MQSNVHVGSSFVKRRCLCSREVGLSAFFFFWPWVFCHPSLFITTKDSWNHIKYYLFTPWCWVLLEKLTGLQLVKRFPAFHETRRFITALTSVRHLSLSWASAIQSIYTPPTSWRSILILSAHLRLGLPSKYLLSKIAQHGFAQHAVIMPPNPHVGQGIN